MNSARTPAHLIQVPAGPPVYVVPLRGSGVVHCQVWLAAGAADEDPEWPTGVAHATEHMVVRAAYAGADPVVARVLDAGAQLAGATAVDHTRLSLRGAATKAGNLVRAALRLPDRCWDSSAWVSERRIIGSEIERSSSRPADSGWLACALGHPQLERPVLGTRESVGRIETTMLDAFHCRMYVGGQRALVVVGDVEPHDVAAWVGGSAEEVVDESGSAWSAPESFWAPNDKLHPVVVSWTVAAHRYRTAGALRVLVAGVGEALKRQRELHIRGEYRATRFGTLAAFLLKAPTPDGAVRARDAVAAALQDTDALADATATLVHERVASMESFEQIAWTVGHHWLMGWPVHSLEYGGADFEGMAGTTLRDTWHACMQAQRPVRLVAQGRPPRRSGRRAFALAVGAARLTTVERAVDPAGPTVCFEPREGCPYTAFRLLWTRGVLRETTDTQGLHALLAEVVRREVLVRLQATSDPLWTRDLQSFCGMNAFGLCGDVANDRVPLLRTAVDTVLREFVPSDELIRGARAAAGARAAWLAGRVENKLLGRLRGALWPDHSYRLPPEGSAEVIQRIDRLTLLAAFEQCCQPQDAVCAYVGGARYSDVVRDAARAGALRPAYWREYRALPCVVPATRVVVDSALAHVLVGYVGTTVTSRDRFALTCITAELSSRRGGLFRALREEAGLAYSVNCLCLDGLESGFVSFYVQCAAPHVDECVSRMVALGAELAERGLSEEDLQRSKAVLAYEHRWALAGRSTRALMYAIDEGIGLGAEEYLRVAHEVGAVTSRDVLEVARRVFAGSTCAVVIGQPPESGHA